MRSGMTGNLPRAGSTWASPTNTGNACRRAAGYYKKATLLNPVYHQALASLAKVLWELRETAQVAEVF